MTQKELIDQIRQKRNFLCVGLDSDVIRIPQIFKKSHNAQLSFNKAIIDATREHCVAYKLNTAFYESQGAVGWKSMAATVEYIGNEHFIIADAKRGDIGNTCKQYAQAFFGEMMFDSITIAPYMGYDSVEPFLEYADKTLILLALTSNKTAADFQFLNTGTKMLWQEVIKRSAEWPGCEDLMYVIGATKAESLREVRRLAPSNFLLVPGVGSQGGSLSEVCENGLNKNCGLLVNSSRGIIFASDNNDFAEAAAKEASQLAEEMAAELDARRILV